MNQNLIILVRVLCYTERSVGRFKDPTKGRLTWCLNYYDCGVNPDDNILMRSIFSLGNLTRFLSALNGHVDRSDVFVNVSFKIRN